MGRWGGRGGLREAKKAERVARGWRKRERQRQRERREEKTEATTVGKIRKWQEMGSCEQGADRLPHSLPATVPIPPGLGLRPLLHTPGRETTTGTF